MTLAIATITSSGIVMTADSRQTYKNNAGAIRIGSDSAMKLFKLNDSCGVAISGRAFLNDTNQSIKDVGFFISKFVATEKLEGQKVKEIAEKLSKYLGNLFVAKELEALKKPIEDRIKQIGGKELTFSASDGPSLPYSYKDKDGKIVSDAGWVETVNMIVAGIDDDKVGRAYTVLIPNGAINEKNTQQCGALWVGQTDVLTRIVKGYAPEIEKLGFVKEALLKDKTVVIEQSNKLEYIINWGTITLQDAIDFCVLMTRTTESIQRFSDGTPLAPGGIPGVGGEIDIAVITPEKGFVWLKHKKLKSEGCELSLDTPPAAKCDGPTTA
jgi:20S proteasome alpha/beta subunit